MQFLVEEALAEHLELVQAQDELAELDDALGGGEVQRSIDRRDRLVAAGGG